MIIETTKLNGVFLLKPTRFADERGHFSRLFCHEALKANGVDFTPLQTSLSFNLKQHTLRGMHFQKAPFGEAKIVRVTRGAVCDVVVDLRPDSSTFKHWIMAELSEDNAHALLIPEGFAHGFLTLIPNTEVFYMMNAPFVAEAASGVRYNDPCFAIEWPAAPQMINERDANWPLL